ncbi:MAG: hypothetical protein GX206_02865 [Clostridiales bacterium]|nr:hypothetical protein [Clostridiales bacterium]
MPMRVKMSGVIGQIIEPYGKFNYGDIVNILKVKISEFDYSHSKACVTDGEGVYWIDMKNLELKPGDCKL